MTDLLYKSEVYAVIGAAMEVHSVLGRGFLEAVYQEAFAIELTQRGIPFVAQQPLHIWYKEQCLEKMYIADFVAFDHIVIEIKALECLSSREEAQLLNYLKATGYDLGLLINFGSPGKLEWKRMARTLRW